MQAKSPDKTAAARVKTLARLIQGNGANKVVLHNSGERQFTAQTLFRVTGPTSAPLLCCSSYLAVPLPPGRLCMRVTRHSAQLMPQSVHCHHSSYTITPQQPSAVHRRWCEASGQVCAEGL